MICRLKNICLFIWITLLYSSALVSEAQAADPDLLFQRFYTLYKAGDLLNAEESLYLILKSKSTLNDRIL
jgi:hypothetical protein